MVLLGPVDMLCYDRANHLRGAGVECAVRKRHVAYREVCDDCPSVLAPDVVSTTSRGRF